MWLYILWVSHLPPCRYNLRKAHDSLKQNWGEYMNETTFNWRMIKQVITQCHVYDEVRREGGWGIDRGRGALFGAGQQGC